MKKFPVALILGVLLLLNQTSAAKQPSAAEKLTRISEKYVKAAFEFNPVYATEMGYHAFDFRYPDFSQRSFGKFAATLRGIRGEMNGVTQTELSSDEKVDFLSLQGDIETQLLFLGRSLLMADNPVLFSGAAIDGISGIMLSPSLSDTAKLEAVLDRLDDLPRFLQSAQKLLKESPQIWILLAEDEADNASAMVNDLGSYFAARFPGRQNEIQKKVSAAANALEDFSDFLDTLKSKEGQPFAVGKEFYDKLLKQQYFLDYDSDSLLKIGEDLFATAARKYDSVSAIVDTLPMPEDFAYFIPKSFNRSDVMDYFQWEVDQTRDWVLAHEFCAIPGSVGDCLVQETPPFAEKIGGGMAYHPAGPFEDVQTGVYFVRPLPDSLSDANRSAYFRYCTRRGFRGAVAHEVYPGRHLQIQMANHNPSLIRRIQRDEMMTEGWPLYCESEMYDLGFNGDDLHNYLSILGGIRLRAARIIVDVKLQTGQFTYQQAVDWMVANLDLEVDYIEKEVSRYTLEPAEPSSHLLGKVYLGQIRELYKTKMGQKYSLRKFHDFILEQGTISPVLIYKQLSGQIF